MHAVYILIHLFPVPLIAGGDYGVWKEQVAIEELQELDGVG